MRKLLVLVVTVVLALVAPEAASARIAGISGVGWEHPPEADFRDVYGPGGLAYRAAWFREESDAERDRQYALANKYGVLILPILTQTYRPRTQAQMDEWLAYVRSVVRRYPAQRYWEIWNEPNADWPGDADFFADAVGWGTFIRATTQAIRSEKAGGKDTVIAGGFALDVPGWESFVDQSSTSQAVSVHTYAAPVTAVARINAADARTSKPIWITEASWRENGSGNQAANTNYVLERTSGKPYFHFTLHEFDGIYWPKTLAATPGTLNLLRLAAAGAAIPATRYADTIQGTAGVTSYWRLGESSGTTATDSKGTTNGSFTGAFTLGQAGALVGDTNRSVAFDGSSGYLSTPANPGAGQGSIEFWGYASSVDSRNGVVYTADNGKSSYTHQLGVRADGSVRLYLWDGQRRIVDSAPGLVGTNEWHHYALTWSDGASARLFVDGVQRGSTAIGNSWKAGNKLLFGQGAGSPSGLTGSWQGRIDEATVYNAALPATEIQQHYNVGRGQ